MGSLGPAGGLRTERRLATEGLALVTWGKEGMWRLDEAAAHSAGSLRVCGGWLDLLLFDLRLRAGSRLRPGCPVVPQRRGVCRTHAHPVFERRLPGPLRCCAYVARQLEEADQVLSKAIVDLAASRPPFAHEGMVRLADLRRRQGRIEEAEQLFRKAESHPMAAVGMAELSLDRDDPSGAISVAEQSAATPSADKQDSAGRRTRARRQGHVRRGRRAWAQVHQAELRSVAQAVPTGPLRAAASFCDGLVAAAAGDQESAAAAFEDAAALFAASDAPYELGRARTELARALADLGRRDLARREAAEALVILERTGARALQKRAQEVLDSLTHTSRPAGPHAPPSMRSWG